MSSTEGKVIKCKAAVAWKADSGVSIEEVNVAPPKAHEVRIKMMHTAICHTDMYTMGGTDPQARFPFIPGHEGAGIVESVGEGVEGFAPGDHVIPIFIPQCKKCDYCKNPRTNICQAILPTQSKGEMPDGTSRFTLAKDGTEIYHFMGCSCFAQYTVVADISLCKINPKAPMDRVCILGCGISTGYGAAINTAQVKEGSTVGVWGLGAVGLAAVMGAKKCGAKSIIGIDKEETKFDLARNFGATDFVNPEKLPNGKKVQDVLCELFNDGFDYTFEAVGQAETMQQALESCHKGWGVSTIIGVAGKGDNIETAPKNLVNGRTWKGTAFGHWKSVDSVPKLVEEYLDGEMDLDSFVTQQSSLDDINQCFKDMESGNNLRIVLAMWPGEGIQQ